MRVKSSPENWRLDHGNNFHKHYDDPQHWCHEGSQCWGFAFLRSLLTIVIEEVFAEPRCIFVNESLSHGVLGILLQVCKFLVMLNEISNQLLLQPDDLG
jgi:hypothetical protein